MPLITLADAKSQLHIKSANLDGELQTYVDGAIRAVERARGEIIESRSFTDEMWLSFSTSFMLSRVPVVSLTSVATLDGVVTWNVANLHVELNSGAVTVLSGAPVNGNVAVVYTAGYASPPPDFKLAAKIILQHLWETQRGADGAVRSFVTGADETYDPRYSYAVPRRALELLGIPLPGVA